MKIKESSEVAYFGKFRPYGSSQKPSRSKVRGLPIPIMIPIIQIQPILIPILILIPIPIPILIPLPILIPISIQIPILPIPILFK